MKPNLFHHASSELSQDAFLCWFMEWADDKYDEEQELKESAKAFIKMLISCEQNISYDKEIHSVEVERQWGKIDISVIINNEIYIIIEDKTNTTAHSNQLQNYKKIAQDWCDQKENGHKLICIYLKTGNEASVKIKKIPEFEGYHYVDRENILTIFEECKTSNAIFNDFVEHLQEIQKDTKSYVTTPPAEWTSCAWQGFYMFLEKTLNESYLYNNTDWYKVNNPQGGFYGFFFHTRYIKNVLIYLQIEQGDLCIKIGDVLEDHEKIRDAIYQIVMEKAQEMGLDKVEKPSRFRNGTYMTIAKVKRDDYLGDLLDKENIIKILKQYMTLLDTCSTPTN